MARGDKENTPGERLTESEAFPGCASTTQSLLSASKASPARDTIGVWKGAGFARPCGTRLHAQQELTDAGAQYAPKISHKRNNRKETSMKATRLVLAVATILALVTSYCFGQTFQSNLKAKAQSVTHLTQAGTIRHDVMGSKAICDEYCSEPDTKLVLSISGDKSKLLSGNPAGLTVGALKVADKKHGAHVVAATVAAYPSIGPVLNAKKDRAQMTIPLLLNFQDKTGAPTGNYALALADARVKFLKSGVVRTSIKVSGIVYSYWAGPSVGTLKLSASGK
jgi:hypothetical protein